MAHPLPKKELERLAAVCGMFGSDHIGERAAAAALADRLIRQAGLRWCDVLALAPVTSAAVAITIVGEIRSALRSPVINDWERRFLISISGRQYLTPKQENKLGQIIEKARISTGARCSMRRRLERDDPHFIARMRAASHPALLARLDQAHEIAALVRAGRACHADLHQEIRTARRRGDNFYAIELARDTGLIDELAEDDSNQKEVK
jgi:hypothetical protein